jgi:hypothetical protein
MRRPPRSWLRAILLTILTAISFDGLAQSLPAPGPSANAPLSAEEEVSLQAIRDFVQATARRYRMVAPLEVSVASWVGTGALPQYASAPAVYTRGTLYLNRRLLRASNRDLVIAKSLAYEMLRTPSQATTLADRNRERARLELDANFRTVDILVQVKGVDERDAVETMYVWLLAIHRAPAAPSRPATAGTASGCDAIQDLLGRFPQHREWFAGRECAPA